MNYKHRKTRQVISSSDYGKLPLQAKLEYDSVFKSFPITHMIIGEGDNFKTTFIDHDFLDSYSGGV
jgi:hypothetical protein